MDLQHLADREAIAVAQLGQNDPAVITQHREAAVDREVLMAANIHGNLVVLIVLAQQRVDHRDLEAAVNPTIRAQIQIKF